MDEMTDQYALCRNSGDEQEQIPYSTLMLMFKASLARSGSPLTVFEAGELKDATKARVGVIQDGTGRAIATLRHTMGS